ncbi:MAG: hypothetical protein D6805_01705 [Planctomycetota bacterium]|nr:MAG: hypothetical protein D6805_01705 [Planctomycetota bacterium]
MRKRQSGTGKEKLFLFSSIFFIVMGTGLLVAVEYHKRHHKKDHHSLHRPQPSAVTVEDQESSEQNRIPFEKISEREYKSDMDEAFLCLVEGGEFILGYRKGSMFWRPESRQKLPQYLMDKMAVTYAQYQRFLLANPEWRKGRKKAVEFADANYLKDWNGIDYPEHKGKHPVVYVSWFAARAYAKWAKRRLPTELEWEKAARGTDGRIYPWGNEPPTKQRANYGFLQGGTTPVDAYQAFASPYGCLNMVGNVWQWCADDFDGNLKVIRGGSWRNLASNLRVFYRLGEDPRVCDMHIGFRCAWSASDTAD